MRVQFSSLTAPRTVVIPRRRIPASSGSFFCSFYRNSYLPTTPSNPTVATTSKKLKAGESFLEELKRKDAERGGRLAAKASKDPRGMSITALAALETAPHLSGGSRDTGDPLTTNVHVGNLCPARYASNPLEPFASNGVRSPHSKLGKGYAHAPKPQFDWRKLQKDEEKFIRAVAKKVLEHWEQFGRTSRERERMFKFLIEADPLIADKESGPAEKLSRGNRDGDF
ncbi:hypothetical protein PTTG_27185 [Puccinia triticina 1-1 BBBD Race 1]|uniref:Uncharacterized protein n=2 Tax=Puccinia triticina TaxID=208348 RepID=A0A180GMP7_PUCT1|nr:uncharacterized protein PtA15_16A254 [Puccinia triticina]OAV93861.1 hypothetical protein PTTG_27185 [Puccinia triticina 1-1 BBBD Race 1]WAQ92348.1 hypothetical protein PtA15_16A254 [Puccinia triticina]WAR64080.1 hypothetical protein PtB15_16B240 [Puccinia triticina]